MTKSNASKAAPADLTPLLSVTRETLDTTPARVLPLLRAIGTSKAIRGLMMKVGYTSADQQKGWALLHAVSGYTAGAELDETDATVRDAMATLDAYDEDFFRILRAALSHHPAQSAFVLDGLGPSVGPASVLGVKAVLMRLDALDSGKDRKATRAADHAALATLAQRGIDAKERTRLAGLVKDAESADSEPVETPAEQTQAGEDHLRGLAALRAWYEDWSEMAKVAVKRRDYLIRMGLAKRKSGKNKPAPTDPNAPPK